MRRGIPKGSRPGRFHAAAPAIGACLRRSATCEHVWFSSEPSRAGSSHSQIHLFPSDASQLVYCRPPQKHRERLSGRCRSLTSKFGEIIGLIQEHYLRGRERTYCAIAPDGSEPVTPPPPLTFSGGGSPQNFFWLTTTSLTISTTVTS